MDERKIQEAVMKRNYLAAQFDALQKEAARLEQILTETMVTQNALKELEKQKEDKEAMIPAGSGVFVKGVIPKTKTVMANIGENVVVEKEIKEVLEMLKQKEEQIRNNMKAVENSIINLRKEYAELSDLIEKARK